MGGVNRRGLFCHGLNGRTIGAVRHQVCSLTWEGAAAAVGGPSRQWEAPAGSCAPMPAGTARRARGKLAGSADHLADYLARRTLPKPRLAREKTITMMPRMTSFQVARDPSVPPP